VDIVPGHNRRITLSKIIAEPVTLFPLSFVIGAWVTSLSPYNYIKMSNAWHSSGDIAMILQKAYSPDPIAASASRLTALSMVISESLIARTFATYALRPFGLEHSSMLLSVLALEFWLIVFAYLVNASGNRSVSTFFLVMSVIKIGGEIKDPHHNVGRTTMIATGICAVT